MPELPEVETIVRDLNKMLKGRKVVSVEVNKPRVVKEIIPSKLEKIYKGFRFNNVRRRAKLLIFDFSNGYSLLAHLMMSGKMIYSKEENQYKHEHVIFHLDNGHKLSYIEPRLFGFVIPIKTSDVLRHRLIAKLGVEPLSKEFNLKKLADILSKKKTGIKPYLLDQTAIAGLGNIYVSEALYLAGIAPKRYTTSIKKEEVGKLHKAIVSVLKQGIKNRGSSIDDYVDASGKPGNQAKYLKVYDREGENCHKCRSKIKKIVMGSRGTYYCPRCQK
ncbi:MAG: bifunctional DNA-formamidopyrimidine glycosylase/DNA-(apurinic or apyrimidinic site) lyase [bacterium]